MKYEAFSRTGGSESGAAKKKPTRKARVATAVSPTVGAGVFVLNDDNYKSFYECMSNPKAQTEPMKQAAARHRELLQRKR